MISYEKIHKIYETWNLIIWENRSLHGVTSVWKAFPFREFMGQMLNGLPNLKIDLYFRNCYTDNFFCYDQNLKYISLNSKHTEKLKIGVKW